MLTAASLGAPWQVWHVELVPPVVVAVFVVGGMPAGVATAAMAAAISWHFVVLAHLWYDMVTGLCDALKIPFLALLPTKRKCT